MAAPTTTVPAMAGAQAVFSYSTDGSAYTALATLKEIKPSTAKKSAPKVSCLASPLGGSTPYHEFSPLGWVDPGEFEAEAFFTKAGYSAWLTLLQGNALVDIKLTFNKLASESVSGSTFVSAAAVTEQGLSPLNTDDDNIVMMPVKVKLSSTPTFTSGS